MTADDRCPCGLGPYADCCARFHTGSARPSTAEQLMRSRYSAFAVGDEAYLRATWAPDTRPAVIDLDPGTRWTGLEILTRFQGGPFDQRGVVEFRAHYRGADGSGVVHERSRFRRENGAWLYVDGDHSTART